MVNISTSLPLSPANVVNLQGCDMYFPLRRVPQGDTFYCIGGSHEAIVRILSEDIARNKTHKRLSYYLNGAQQGDVSGILHGLMHHQSHLKGWHINLTFSNLLYSSLETAWSVVRGSISHFKEASDLKIDMQAVFMDNEETDQLDRFRAMQKPFTGVMCNLGGAKITSVRPLAAMLWGMTKAGGWVQADQKELLEYFIDKARTEGGVHRGLTFESCDDAYPTGIHLTSNIKEGFHWIRLEDK